MPNLVAESDSLPKPVEPVRAFSARVHTHTQAGRMERTTVASLAYLIDRIFTRTFDVRAHDGDD